MRHHGFQFPLHPLQVLAWVLYCGVLAFHFLFVGPIFWPVTKFAFTTVFSVAALIAAGLAYKSTRVDPRDTEPVDPRRSSEDTNYCYLCKHHVHHGTLHCRACDKCVRGFDHHCKWLNNCIGEHNYRYFVATLAATLVVLLVECGFLAAVILWNAINPARFEEQVAATFGCDQRSPLSGSCFSFVVSPTVVFGASIAVGTLLLVGVGMVGHLLGFHIYLIRNGLTTYEYIVGHAQRRRRRSRQRGGSEGARRSARDTQYGPGVSSGNDGGVDETAMQADVEAALSPSLEAQVVELVPSWEDATAQPAVLAADGSQPPRHAPAADRSSPASSDDVATPPEAAPAGEATVAADEGPRTGVANVPAASEEHEASGGAATCDDATEERGVQPALLDAATSLDRRPHAADTLQGADAGAAESADAEIAHATAADHDDAAPADGNAAEATLPLPEA